jgi:hypothetical protein
MTQRRHDRPIRRTQLRLLDLTAHDAKLVPEQKKIHFRIADAQPYIHNIEE